MALKVPNFDVLFDQVRAVSPLARQAFEEDAPGGFWAVEDAADVHRWKVVSKKPRRLVSRIDKTSSRVRRSWETWRAPAAGPGDAGLIRDRVRHRTK